MGSRRYYQNRIKTGTRPLNRPVIWTRMARKNQRHHEPWKKTQVLKVKKVLASKNLTQVNTSASAGSIVVNNLGWLTIFTAAAQNTQYFSACFAFILTDLPEHASYSALYDRYRLKEITLRLFPVNTTSASAVNIVGAPATGPSFGNGNLGGFMYAVKDYDDNTALTASDVGFDTLRNRPSFRQHNLVGTKPFVIKIRPRIAMAGYDSSAVFTGYTNQKAQWIDTASPSDAILHYGIKVGFEVLNPDAQVNYLAFKCEAEYHVEFKDPI